MHVKLIIGDTAPLPTPPPLVTTLSLTVSTRSPRPTSVMLPATNACPPGWTEEYTGHVMSGFAGHPASTEYVCVDRAPQDRPGGQGDRPGGRLYYTVSKCGTLPCPPFQEGKILLCAVCSR